MIYVKPEIVVLGRAAAVIQTGRIISAEPWPTQGLKKLVPDAELDD